MLLNRASEPRDMTVALKDIPWLGHANANTGSEAFTCEVLDVWAGTTRLCSEGVIAYKAVRSHQAILLRLDNCSSV